eukprot:1291643-Rhodomonas_salina.4
MLPPGALVDPAKRRFNDKVCPYRSATPCPVLTERMALPEPATRFFWAVSGSSNMCLRMVEYAPNCRSKSVPLAMVCVRVYPDMHSQCAYKSTHVAIVLFMCLRVSPYERQLCAYVHIPMHTSYALLRFSAHHLHSQ